MAKQRHLPQGRSKILILLGQNVEAVGVSADLGFDSNEAQKLSVQRCD